VKRRCHYGHPHRPATGQLSTLKRYEEALKAYDRAIQLAPYYAQAYKNKSRTLDILGRTAEAQQARQKAHEQSV
jgi:tetratricopeptide (TPR) repeat protein